MSENQTTLTKEEASAALLAIGQMTNGNARDFNEWKLQTSGTRAEWNALLRAETKLKEIANHGR
jgi:hypothetical protein